jgi:hypothetical protein
MVLPFLVQSQTVRELDSYTVKFHFVTIKHVVMFFKLQFSYQQLVFIFKIVKTLVTLS